jgi:hypothetical protein
MAKRRGLAVRKCRRRDPRAIDFGGYHILDPHCNVVVAGAHPVDFSFTLDDVEEWLTND